jgi:hypothetical protein
MGRNSIHKCSTIPMATMTLKVIHPATMTRLRNRCALVTWSRHVRQYGNIHVCAEDREPFFRMCVAGICESAAFAQQAHTGGCSSFRADTRIVCRQAEYGVFRLPTSTSRTCEGPEGGMDTGGAALAGPVIGATDRIEGGDADGGVTDLLVGLDGASSGNWIDDRADCGTANEGALASR